MQQNNRIEFNKISIIHAAAVISSSSQASSSVCDSHAMSAVLSQKLYATGYKAAGYKVPGRTNPHWKN